MHRVLIIRELQRLIFDCFLPDFDVETIACAWTESFQKFIPDREARGTLLNLALTCRAFEDSALDALWWAMEDLTPLFAMLKSYREVGNTKLLRGAISTLEVENFFSYAARIKLFYLRGPASISSTAYVRILAAGKRHHLLPSLKYLLSNQSLPDLFIFVSPNLLVVNISNECAEGEELPDETYIRTFNDSLADISPGLVGLRIHFEMTTDCLRAVLSLPNLKYLHLDNFLPNHCHEQLDFQSLDFDFMRRLSSRLCGLEIFGSIDLLLAPGPASQALTFRTLRKINLQTEPMGSIRELTNLFSVATFPALQSFTALPFGHDHSAPVDDLRDFLASLIGATTPGLLSSIDLFTDWHPDFHAKISLSSIPELLRFRLTRLRINFLQDLSADDIKTMSAAWPNLRELRLDSLEGFVFDILIAVAQNFSNLRYLHLDVDLRVLPAPDDVPMVFCHPLGHLAIYPRDDGPLQNPFDFAVSLANLFPHLHEVSAPYWNNETGRSWKDMAAMLKVIQFARIDPRLAQDLEIVIPSDSLCSPVLNRERVETLGSYMALQPLVVLSTPE
ncbi:hypothetical protein CVT26_014822 [Gymnopilus dilepis]|uniref:F-box domain-containing protein n=1 Tax=Gymnopilus dilepis TaxID=231916 RepID=A0A409W3V4_9AGAR|nr:hypothetical protein CVT26_014822 [Gymnopilus dilepis]